MKAPKHILGWSLIGVIIIVAATAIFYGATTVEETDLTATDEYSVTEEIIMSSGPWAPLVFILAQALQAMIAPIPGPVVTMAGGYLFGGAIATVLGLLGSATGFAIVFVIAKKIGLPLLKRILKPHHLEKYENAMSTHGRPFLFLAFLVPILPDSIIGYIAGVSKLPIKTLLIIATLGRLPTTVVAAFIGSSAAAANYTMTIIGVALVLIFIILVFLYRKQLERWLLREVS